MSDDAVLKVALPLPLPRLFDYRAPHGAPTGTGAGQRVRVPFGAREMIGVVDGVAAIAHDGALKHALEVLDHAPLLHGELLASLRWLARYTHAPPGEVYATALPAALRRGEPMPDTHASAWRLLEAGRTAAPGLRKGSRTRRLAELLQVADRDEDALSTLMDGWRDAARALARRNLAERVAIPASSLAPAPQPGPQLNAEQQVAVDAVLANDGFGAFLLDGVTGSGKTEVYLHLVADCLARGKQALVLVPEIGLTPQLLARFRARLGVPVHATHSGLTDNERAQAWAAAWRGEARVVVGTRSAVFTPLPDAGLVIVDEEHDASYKQQDGIRYHARDFALVRGKALGVPVVLGSATPSLESLHNASAGRSTHLRLTRRAGEARTPTVRVLDVRKRPLQAGLSPEALEAIGNALEAGGQVLVFKNRRGYAPVLLCHDCGWSAQCKRCSTPEHGNPMTVHGAGRRLQCHHCGARAPRPLACPDCASLALQPQGVGTERIEELLAERFGAGIGNDDATRTASSTESADSSGSVRAERSQAQLGEVEAHAPPLSAHPSTSGLRPYAQGERIFYPVIRIDSASTRRKDGLAKALASLGDAPGILVGTQMLAKGHDLPNLTLVCVVGIDEGLFSADFRSREKLSQLLVQVAGRAGRADRAGQVLLQTHHPDHPLLQTLVAGGYHAFAADELVDRQAAGFPPFAAMALLRAEAQHADAPLAFLQQARVGLSGDDGVAIDGPMPAPMPRRAGLHRAQLLLTAPSRARLLARLDAAVALYDLPEARKVRWSLDVDPIDLY